MKKIPADPIQIWNRTFASTTTTYRLILWDDKVAFNELCGIVKADADLQRHDRP